MALLTLFTRFFLIVWLNLTIQSLTWVWKFGSRVIAIHHHQMAHFPNSELAVYMILGVLQESGLVFETCSSWQRNEIFQLPSSPGRMVGFRCGMQHVWTIIVAYTPSWSLMVQDLWLTKQNIWKGKYEGIVSTQFFAPPKDRDHWRVWDWSFQVFKEPWKLPCGWVWQPLFAYIMGVGSKF